ncbi:BLUF domain-containing protein [Zhongshania arctica]|uniref:BLUF domain-containing protein n=1 Tax=Zhongshania arctica TaxID=3238302 RepID=A0ABV3TY71_9GAMM
MFLTRLIYASQPSNSFKPEDIEKILVSARRNNAAKAVTGLLYFNQHYFLQCLEGSRSAVNEIYHKIIRDDRHQMPLILDYTETIERNFSTWGMAYLPETEVTRVLYAKFSGLTELSPYHMRGESCHKLMGDLRTAIPAV